MGNLGRKAFGRRQAVGLVSGDRDAMARGVPDRVPQSESPGLSLGAKEDRAQPVAAVERGKIGIVRHC
jgi:hypothetical protein